MIALVLSAAPADTSRTRAGIDLAMTLATFETPFELFFVGDACQVLVPDLPPAKRIGSLPLYGKDHWVYEAGQVDSVIGGEAKSLNDIQQSIRECSQVIRL